VPGTHSTTLFDKKYTVDAYYVAPVFMDKVVVHIATNNFMGVGGDVPVLHPAGDVLLC
jgi:hypothetical protein